SIHHHAADALAFVHQVEALVDVGKRHAVGDDRVDLDFPLHVPVDDLRHVGAAARAAEGGALPDPAGDQLKRPRRNLLPGAGDADDHAHAPAAVRAFERLAHHRDVAGAVEGVVGAADLVGAALGHVDEIGNEACPGPRAGVTADLLRIDEMGHAEALAPRLLGVVDVDADDHV